MRTSYDGEESLSAYAMRLYYDAGHIDTLYPLFEGHSAKQMVYFDCAEQVIVTEEQKTLLNYFDTVSYLFVIDEFPCYYSKKELERIRFYSINLTCRRSMRSQITYDIHRFLHSLIDDRYTVLLCQHDDEFVFSFAGDNQDYVLSDWFGFEDDYEEILERIHIANISLFSPIDYFTDLAYSLARDYYIHPMSKEYVRYSLLPSSYQEDTRWDHKTIAEKTDEVLNRIKNEYGDDYFDFSDSSIEQYEDVGKELDLLWMDLDKESSNSPIEQSDDQVTDTFEFEDMDADLFEDPEKLISFLDDTDL